MNFSSLVQIVINSVLTPVTVLIVGLAVFYFLWGVLKYIQSVGDETKRKEGASMMTYGIIGLFVMGALWGLVHVLDTTFDFPGKDTPIKPPTLTGSSNTPTGSSFGSSPSPTDLGLGPRWSDIAP